MGNSYIESEYKDPGYAEAKRRSIEKTTNIYDADIASTANKSAQSAAVQGIGNVAGITADAYSRSTDAKNRRISSIEDQYNNYELQHKAAFNNQNAFMKQKFEMEKPGFLEYLGLATNIGTGLFGIGSAAGLFGKSGGDKSLGSFLNSGLNPPTVPLGIDVSPINSLSDIRAPKPEFPNMSFRNNSGLNKEWSFDPRLFTKRQKTSIFAN